MIAVDVKVIVEVVGGVGIDRICPNLVSRIYLIVVFGSYKLLQMQGQMFLLGHPGEVVSSVIGCINRLVEENPVVGQQTSVFDLKTAPTISVADYLARMVKYMNASASVYVYALVLLDRAQEYNLRFTIHAKNVHRLLLASCLVAVKYLEDFFYKNSYYASVGGVSLKVLNQLEEEFLHLINFNCQVEPETLDSYLQRLQLFTLVNQHPASLKENAALAPQKAANWSKMESRGKQINQQKQGEEPGVVERGVRDLNCSAECV